MQLTLQSLNRADERLTTQVDVFVLTVVCCGLMERTWCNILTSLGCGIFSVDQFVSCLDVLKNVTGRGFCIMFVCFVHLCRAVICSVYGELSVLRVVSF